MQRRSRIRMIWLGMGIAVMVGLGGLAWAVSDPSARGATVVSGAVAPAFTTTSSTRGPVTFSGRGPAILYFYEADT